MDIEIKIVEGSKMLKTFIRLTAAIHQNDPDWLPPIYMDEYRFFNPIYNKALGYCDTIMAIAFRKGVPSGRIMGIIHHPYNELKNERTARFSHFECYNHSGVARALLGFIENWAREKGMTQVTGPYGFSDKDPQGFLVEGYGDTPLIDASCNLPYMVDLTIENGYEKLVDCLTYRFSIHKMLPEIYNRVQQRLLNSRRYEVIEFTTKRKLKPFIVPVLRLVNQTYQELYGFYPMDEAEMQDLASRYMPVIDPRFVKVIKLEDEIAAFVVGLPNMTRGIQKAKGKMLPFGWIHILNGFRNATQLDLMLGAVKNGQQGLGLEICMGLRLLDSAKKAGMKTIETHLILETNTPMRSVIERLEVPVAKRYRVFRKVLDQQGSKEQIR
ncbi:MAG TPA: hypothetical protein PLV51_02320 [Lentimicrobium sp.]|nr:hypothetical protein [Lentimicrobium sp.]